MIRTKPALLVNALIALAIVGWSLAIVNAQDAREPVHAVATEAVSPLSSEETHNIAIFEQASPSVVFITSRAVRPKAFRLDATNLPAGSGSGLMWDKDGHIVTNFHLISQANAATVTLADQTSWPAKLVGAEPDKDIAVLRIDAPAEKLRPLSLGSSTDLRVGQNVYAIGNPFGLDQTLTTGIISGLGREIQSITGRPILDVIQTDAAINPGNSGGPLLNSSGQVIGVNTAIFSPSGASSGVGFAVPIDTVKRLVPQILENGHVQRASIGVVLGPDHVSRQSGIEGLIIVGVIPGTPAESAGFQPVHQDRQGRVLLGDVITKIDDKPVKTSNELYLVLENYSPGDTVTVTVIRAGNEVNIELILADLAEM